MSNPATLRPWTSANGGNPPPLSPGRPRKRPQSEANEDFLRKPLEVKERLRLQNAGYKLPAKCTNADGIAIVLGIKALRGDVSAAKELRESVEGKSRIRLEVEDKTQQQPRLVVVFEGNAPDRREITAQAASLLPEPSPVDRAIDMVMEQESDDDESET